MVNCGVERANGSNVEFQVEEFRRDVLFCSRDDEFVRRQCLENVGLTAELHFILK